jgi:hypothetical protein
MVFCFEAEFLTEQGTIVLKDDGFVGVVFGPESEFFKGLPGFQ